MDTGNERFLWTFDSRLNWFPQISQPGFSCSEPRGRFRIPRQYKAATILPPRTGPSQVVVTMTAAAHGCLHLNNFKAAKGTRPYRLIHSFFVACTSSEARKRKVHPELIISLIELGIPTPLIPFAGEIVPLPCLSEKRPTTACLPPLHLLWVLWSRAHPGSFPATEALSWYYLIATSSISWSFN